MKRKEQATTTNYNTILSRYFKKNLLGINDRDYLASGRLVPEVKG